MNPLDWEHARRGQQRDLDQKQRSGVDGNTGNVSRPSGDPFCGYTREDPRTSMRTSAERDHGSPPSHNLYRKEYAAAFTSSRDPVPDRERQVMSKTDQELARKRRRLQEIEEQIIIKRANIAMKRLESMLDKKARRRTFKEEEEEEEDLALLRKEADMPMKKNEPSVQLRGEEKKEDGFLSLGKLSAACKGATLKDRVNVILRQRRPLGVVTKVSSSSSEVSSKPAERKKADDHPLKLRVMALMRRRRSIPCEALLSNREVLKIEPLPPSPSPPPTTPKENTVSDGFQRFLSVLNKGVDINLLSKIVNDEVEDLPVGGEPLNIQPPVLEDKSNVPSERERKGSHSDALQQHHSRSNSGERRPEPPRRDGSHKETHSLPEEKCVQRNDGGDSGSSSRFKSAPEVEEKKPNVEDQQQQQHKHLQNILKTLGLSLEMEEMSKLSDRTHERLYGRKPDEPRVDNRVETETPRSDRERRKTDDRDSLISGSFSSPSPPRRQRSPGRDSRESRERRKTSEPSRSRERSGEEERPRCGDGDSDADRVNSRGRSPGPSPDPEKTTHPSPQPAALAALPGDMPASPRFKRRRGGKQSKIKGNQYQRIPSLVGPFPQQRRNANSVPPDDDCLMLNPDLSECEGQNGKTLRPRCLQSFNFGIVCPAFITKRKRKRQGDVTKKISQRNYEQINLMNEMKRKIAEKDALKRSEVPELETQHAEDQPLQWIEQFRLMQDMKKKMPPALVSVAVPEAETQRSEEVKKQALSEEEVKANLKKTLQAFNQMMKRKAS